jgi:hypothetical protein
MPISTWEPSELDKQTQIAKQALARIAELEAESLELRVRGDNYLIRAERAEAELATLKGRRCGTCTFHTLCSIEDAGRPMGMTSCSEWTARAEEGGE